MLSWHQCLNCIKSRHFSWHRYHDKCHDFILSSEKNVTIIVKIWYYLLSNILSWFCVIVVSMLSKVSWLMVKTLCYYDINVIAYGMVLCYHDINVMINIIIVIMTLLSWHMSWFYLIIKKGHDKVQDLIFSWQQYHDECHDLMLWRHQCYQKCHDIYFLMTPMYW